MKIAIATGNAHKVKELSRLLDIEGIEFVSLRDLGFTGDIIEDGKTFAENAMIKAKFICDKYSIPAIADDSGLCVDALCGEPGIYSARYASKDGGNSDDAANIDLLLENMKSIPSGERSARFVCSMAFCAPDGVSLTVDGICEGHITSDIRGEGGFGYDPVFYCTKLCKTFGEATDEEKNTVSHRYNACKLLAVKLKEYIEKQIERSNKMSIENLTSSERAYLRGLANGLDAIFQLGKGGINENFIKQIDDVLEVRELIKISLLETSEYTVKEAAEEICKKTGAQSVQMIGRKLVLYRAASDKDKRKITLPKSKK